MRSRLMMAAVPVLFAVACGDSGSGGAGGVGGPETSPAEGTLGSMLQWVPDSARGRGGELYFSNLDLLREGTESPSAEEDLLVLLHSSSGQVYLPRRYGDCLSAGRTSELGWDSRQVTAAVEFGDLPEVVDVLQGTIDANAVETALRGSPGGEGLQIESSPPAMTRFSLGEEGSVEVSERSCYRPLGQGVFVSIDASGLLSSNSAAAVSEAISAGAGASLADDPAYAAVAAALDGAGVEVAMLQGHGWEGATWVLAAIGESIDGDADFTTKDPSIVTVVLVYASPEGAAAGARALEEQLASGVSMSSDRPWSEVFAETEVTAAGTTVVATLHASEAGWIRLLAMQDALLTV